MGRAVAESTVSGSSAGRPAGGLRLGGNRTRIRLDGQLLLALVLGAAFLLLVAGCEGGSTTGFSQSCSSSGGVFSGETMTCSGTADSVSGSVGIEFGEEDLLGDRRLTLTVSVEEGSAEVYAYNADGDRTSLGRVGSGEPLTTEVIVDPFGDDTVFFVDAGKGEIEGLRYEGTVETL